jgi:hypothetical protein
MAILIALTANMVFKTLLCASIAGPRLAWRVGLSLSAALIPGFTLALSGFNAGQWIGAL